jgi:hypothetical protein
MVQAKHINLQKQRYPRVIALLGRVPAALRMVLPQLLKRERASCRLQATIGCWVRLGTLHIQRRRRMRSCGTVMRLCRLTVHATLRVGPVATIHALRDPERYAVRCMRHHNHAAAKGQRGQGNAS